MDSFYSRLAAEADDDWDTHVSKEHGDRVDMDDLLDDLDFSDEPKLKSAPVAQSALDISYDSLKLAVEENPPVSSSITDHQVSASASSAPPVGRQNASNSAQRNSKRNILDSLLALDAPIGEPDAGVLKIGNNKGESSMDTSFEVKGCPSKRSVRFSENLADDPFNLDTDVLGKTSTARSCGKDVTNTNRPQTAPSGRQRGAGVNGGSTGWGDLGEEFNWSPKVRTVGKNDQQKTTTCNISFDGGIDLDGTISDKKAVLGETTIQEDETCHAGVGGSDRKGSTNLEMHESSQNVKKLETEIEGLKGLLKLSHKYHKDEISLLEESHASKIKLLEENSLRRETHLKEELEFNVTQCRDRIAQMEQYHDASRGDFVSTVAAVKGDATKTIENLRNEHTSELELLAERHARALASLREADTNEARVLSDMQPTAQALQQLLSQLLTVTTEVKQAEQDQQVVSTQRLAKLDRREEILRLAEERLCGRERESEKAHQMLTEEIAKLEVQLREQGKVLTDDRWMLKQEQVRLKKLQITLDEDRRTLVDLAGRERSELQQQMANFFSEHRETQTRLTTERNQIAEQQQKLRTDQLSWRKRQEDEEEKINKMRNDLDRARETFQLERHTLDERMHQLQLNEVKLTETQRHLDIIRNNFLSKETELTERAALLDKRDEELTARAGALNGTQAAVAEVDAKCRRLMEEHAATQSRLDTRSRELDSLERGLSEEQANIAKREEEFAKKLRVERTLICCRCKQTVKKVSASGRTTSARISQADNYDNSSRWAKVRTPDPTMPPSLDVVESDTAKLIEDMSNQHTRSRMLEQLKQELAKDNEFLEEERIYLSGLRHTPYA